MREKKPQTRMTMADSDAWRRKRKRLVIRSGRLDQI